jgi:hypothetical protein
MDDHGEWVDSTQIAEFFKVEYNMGRSIIEQITRRNLFKRTVKREGSVQRTLYQLAFPLDECIAKYDGNTYKDPIPIDDEHDQWMRQYRQRFIHRYQHIHGLLPNFL